MRALRGPLGGSPIPARRGRHRDRAEGHRARARQLPHAALAAAAFVLFCFGLLAARLVYLQVVKLRGDGDAGREQPHRGRADRAQPRPDRRPQRRRARRQLLGLHAGDHAVEGAGDRRGDDRRAGAGHRHPAARPQALQAPAEEGKNFESLPIRTRLTDEEVARFTAQRFRFPASRSRRGCSGQPSAGETASHLIGYIGRINQAEKAAIDDRGRAQLPRHRIHRQARRRTELRGRAARRDRVRGDRDHRRRARRAPPAEQRRDARQQGHAGDRHPAAGARRAAVHGDRRGAGRDRPAQRRDPGLVSKPNFDPNLFVDGIDADNWKRAQRVDRQAAEPGAARHLPARLDLQAPAVWPR